jgi:hypothetical protein
MGVTESLDRAEAFTRQLRRELTVAAGFLTVEASILAEASRRQTETCCPF